MNIQISLDNKIQDIKTQFHTYFPNLKIEFFKSASEKSGATGKSEMYGNDIVLSSIITDLNENTFEFSEGTTVNDFEKTMFDNFGLHTQVFRKSGTLYLETVNTDDWTLEKQNSEALASLEKPELDPNLDLTDRDKWE